MRPTRPRLAPFPPLLALASSFLLVLGCPAQGEVPARGPTDTPGPADAGAGESHCGDPDTPPCDRNHPGPGGDAGMSAPGHDAGHPDDEGNDEPQGSCPGEGEPCETGSPCTRGVIQCRDGEPRCATAGPADRGTMCRPAACAGDTAEVCDGDSTECPAPCGCQGQPCCEGSCGNGLRCVDGTCCASPEVGLEGGLTGSCGEDTSEIMSIQASGNTLTVCDRCSCSDITLQGFTAEGGHTGRCGRDVSEIMSIQASGNTLTVCDRCSCSDITLQGATAENGLTGQCSGDVSEIMSVESSGDGSLILCDRCSCSEIPFDGEPRCAA